MGSSLSIYNNTKDTYLVKVGKDEAAVGMATLIGSIIGAIGALIVSLGELAPLSAALVANGVVAVFGVSTATIAAITAAAASISAIAIGTTAADWAITAAVFISNHLKEEGFVEIPPGEKHTFGKYTLSLWRQATCRRIRVVNDEVQADVLYMRPIFSGATKDSVLEHNIQHWIDKWGHEDHCVIKMHKENFSASSKDISFADGKLRAKCRDSQGTWRDAVLDLNYYYQNVDGIVKLVKKKPGNFMATCSDLELKGAKLFGMAKNADSRKVKFELDLDIDIGNKEGSLVCPY